MLLSKKRLHDDKQQEKPEPGRSPFQKDYDRIVFSSAFRRLQDKTQVFPLPESDYVRTRLTHSLEASCVARSLGTLVGEKLLEEHSDIKGYSKEDFGAIVAAATLAHDIGNPPFGHSGEEAIRHFFKQNKLGKKLLEDLLGNCPAEAKKSKKADFVEFEGNAQGFRILTTLQHSRRRGGMRLTCATLAAFTKYPRESSLDKKVFSDISYLEKYGFFQSELENFEEVAKQTGLLSKSKNGIKAWARHPLAFLVEAADDICYAIIDLEDGVKLRCVDYNDAKELLLALFTEKKRAKIEKGLKKLRDEKEQIEYLRANAIGELIDQVARHFMDKIPEMLEGNYTGKLLKEIEKSEELKTIKNKDKNVVYTEQNAVFIEAAGYEIIGGLLETFLRSVEEIANKNDDASPHSRKILQLIPQQFKKDNENVDSDPYSRTMKITDYVSGMTDSFALSTYKKIKGIALPRPG